MAMDMDEEESAVERVTLRCLGRNVPATAWHKLAREATLEEDASSVEGDRPRLATLLVSCLFSYEAISPIVLEYMLICIAEARSSSNTAAGTVLCSSADICQAMLDSQSTSELLSKREQLAMLASALVASPESTQVPFTTERCTSAASLYHHAKQQHLEPISKVALGVLAHFSSAAGQRTALADDSSAGQQAHSDCLAQIEAALKVSTTESESKVFLRLQKVLVRYGREKESKASSDKQDERKQARQWSEQDLLSHFRSLVTAPGSVGESSTHSWSTDASASPFPPETAVLLHSLVDSYSPYQAKVDAVKMAVKARMSSSSEASEALHILLGELFQAAASACAIVAGTPSTLGGDEGYTTVWRSALCGLLVSIAVSVRDGLSADGLAAWTTKQVADTVKNLLSEPSNALAGCEVMLVEKKNKKRDLADGDDEAEMMLDVFIGTDDGPAHHPVRAGLLRCLSAYHLIDRAAVAEIERTDTIKEDLRSLPETYLDELNPSGADFTADLVALFEQKLQSEVQEEGDLLSRIFDDYACQHAFSQAVAQMIAEGIASSDLDMVARLCKLLTSNATALDVVLLYTCPTQLLHPIARLMDEESDLLQHGEDPAMIGTILLFSQLVAQRALDGNHSVETLLPCRQYLFLNAFIRSVPASQIIANLATAEQGLVSSWITALFGSEGISDELIKASNPQTMLQIAPTLFSQSIMACCSDVIDVETLRGGLTYFLQDLLSYTLPCSINWLLWELSRYCDEDVHSPFQDELSKGKRSKTVNILLEVLVMLLLSETCPQVVLTLTATRTVDVLKLVKASDDDRVGKVKSVMESHLEPKKSAKTHLWIKISQGSMKPCSADSLLHLDSSFEAIQRKRGTKAALQIVSDKLNLDAKSETLPRAITMSLSLAHLGSHLTTTSVPSLTNNTLVAFALSAVNASHAVRSAIATLHLTLSIIQEPRDAEVRQAVESIVALRVRRLLKVARNPEEVEMIARLYGMLFSHLDERPVLASFLTKIESTQ